MNVQSVALDVVLAHGMLAIRVWIVTPMGVWMDTAQTQVQTTLRLA